jgi:hypothetical protein
MTVLTPEWIRVSDIPSVLFHPWGVAEGAVIYHKLPEQLPDFGHRTVCVTQYVGRPVVCSCGLITLGGFGA